MLPMGFMMPGMHDGPDLDNMRSGRLVSRATRPPTDLSRGAWCGRLWHASYEELSAWEQARGSVRSASITSLHSLHTF
jgi:hypothetical protein